MTKNKKEFRVVFVKENNQYGVQFRTDEKEWLSDCLFPTYLRTENGDVIRNLYDGELTYFISEDMLWKLHHYYDLGYSTNYPMIHRVDNETDFWSGK